MRALLAALTLAALLSGCTEPEAAALQEAAEGADVPEDASAAFEDLAVEAVPLAVPDPLSGITSFHWASTEALPAFALEFVADFGEDNECDLESGSVSGPGVGPKGITIYEQDGAVGWGAGSSGSGYGSAHAGPVDTRSVGSPSGGGSTLHGSHGRFDGTWTITMLAQTVEPGESPFFTEEVASALSIECDQPFSLRDARASSEAVLFNEFNLAGGAGAEAFLVGSAGVGDQVAATMASSAVRVAAAGFGVQYADVEVASPSGGASWQFLPEAGVPVSDGFHSLDDGPGGYSVTVDRAGAYFEAFWGGIWGLEPGYDLTANQRAESVIDSPF